MSAERVALDHYRARQRLAVAASVAAARLWAQVDPGRIVASWRLLLPQLLVVLVGAQQAAARAADGYVDSVLAEQGVDADAVGRVDAVAFSGVASDGRDLDSLLVSPAFGALTTIAGGTSSARALAGGSAALDMMVRTQVADAGRTADQVALTARPQATGYVRMLVGKSCSRCAILAGRRYAFNQGFLRHPRCLPAGVMVSGPAWLAAARRWYEGELVIITTASGQELPITGNHPVLTDRGWVPANLVQEGDHVVSSTRPQGAVPLVVPDEQHVPSRVEDCWRSRGVVAVGHVPTATEDFHGDGGHGDVNVVLSDRLLRDRAESTLGKHGLHQSVGRRVAGPFDLPVQRVGDQELVGVPAAPIGGDIGRLGNEFASALVGLNALLGDPPAGLPGLLGLPWLPGEVGVPGLELPRLWSHLGGPNLAGGGHVPDLYPLQFQASPNDVSADLEAQAEGVLALATEVRGGDLGIGEADFSPRWDPPAGPLTVETRGAYAEPGQDLLLRLSGQVELDRVVELRRVAWSGHVYNLTSAEGWYSANGLIVSNCDCIHIPAREDSADDLRTDPKAYFNSLSAADQDRIFTKAGAEAIRSGADMARVVNSRRGMYEAGGRQFTAEAAGRRPRLMPEEILRQAGTDRDEALRLLRLHSYLR